MKNDTYLFELLQHADPTKKDYDTWCDEINARVWCYLRNRKFIDMTEKAGGGWDVYHELENGERLYLGFASCTLPDYATSRDILKSARPDNYMVCGHYALATALGYTFSLFKKGTGKDSVTGHGKTEELAELHAVLLAHRESSGFDPQCLCQINEVNRRRYFNKRDL